MDSYILDWLYVMFRWAHIITAIAWIGASFYFVWLDNHLEKPFDPQVLKKGVHGELWAVHGGGFYNSQKYLLAPPQIPKNLHWFYWESYSTWMTGFGLFLIVYLFNAQAYLVDPNLFPMIPSVAVYIALSMLLVTWIVYDLLCRLLINRGRLLNFAIAVYVVILAIVACRIFPGRAAFLITGASMATVMSANVLVWIIPGQRKVLAAMKAGDAVDPTHGQRGKQRSVHNTYFTLPVLFCMLSNHFGFISMHQYNWLALVLMMLAGVFIRQYFIERHHSKNRWDYIILSLVLIVSVMILVKPEAQGDGDAASMHVGISDQKIAQIVHERCYGCHAQKPKLLAEAPKGISFESFADIERYASQIYIQSSQTKAMPLGNVTQMTQKERNSIAAWYKARQNH